MELFVTRVDSSNLLISVTSNLDPLFLNYDFQITEEECSNAASVVVCVEVENTFPWLFQT